MAADGPMYSLKPVTIPGDVSVPDVMYSLKSYHNPGEMGDVSMELGALEQRQDRILEDLKKLKIEVDSLVQGSSKPSGPEGKLWETTVTQCPAFKKGEVVQDIAITADPSNPPLSVILLCDMLTKQYSVFTTCYTHSSIGALGDKVKAAIPPSNGITRNAADMAISLIWAQGVSRPRLCVSGVTLEGEAVIARYLARLLKRPASIYEQDHLAAVTEQDFYLDLAVDLGNGDSAAIEILQKKLSTSQFLGGGAFSLADMVLFSVLSGRQGQLPAAVSSWLQRCCTMPQFQAAVNVL